MTNKMINMSTPRLTNFNRVSTPAMVTATGVDTTPEAVETDPTLWDKTKGFMVENKELLAVGAVVGIGAGYLYYRHKQQQQLAEQVKGVFDNFEKDLKDLDEASKPTVTTTVSAV